MSEIDERNKGLIRDIDLLRQREKSLLKEMDAKQSELMGERRLRLKSDQVRDMALRELYTCQTGMDCAEGVIAYYHWVERWVKEHSV